MFRWPVSLTPLSLGADGLPREAALEVTPRGAIFTLAALSHVGHPAHLALVDAYLKGQVRMTPTASIGDDTRTVVTSLAVPLLAAYELGVERLTLADVILLKRQERPALRPDLSAEGRPTFTPDSPRLLLRAHEDWHWVRGAERFEADGCQGTQRVGLGDPWVHVVAALPEQHEIEASAQAGRWPTAIVAEVRAASTDDGQPGLTDIAWLRALALARFARAPDLKLHVRGLVQGPSGPLPQPSAHSHRTTSHADEPVNPLDSLIVGLTAPRSEHRSYVTRLQWRGLGVDVSLVPDLDGYQTLCLLPPAGSEPASLFEPMRDLAWEIIEGLIGRPLPERRTEPIALRLLAKDGRATTLDVGASVVIGRNQMVFTCWVGSDGRVMLKLFPPGGMSVR